jgi:predicted transcriptional regulator
MADAGLSGRDIAERLEISPSAVSQRLARASLHEGRRGAELAEALLAEADA